MQLLSIYSVQVFYLHTLDKYLDLYWYLGRNILGQGFSEVWSGDHLI